MKMGHCKTTSATYLMMLTSLSLIWAPAVSGSFGTLFQLKQTKPLAVSTGFASNANTLATSAVAQWINQHRALTITTTVAAIGLIAAFAYVIKKYRDNQPLSIPPAPPVPPVEPTRYVRHRRPFVQKLQIIPEESSSTPTTALPSSSTSSQSASTTSATTPLVTASKTLTAPASSSFVSTSCQSDSRWKLYPSNNPGNAFWLSRMPNPEEFESLKKQLRSQAPAGIESAPFKLSPVNSADSPLMQTSSSSSAPSSSSATTTFAPIHPIESSSRTVLSSSTSSSTASPSQGRRSPTVSDKASANYRETITQALSDLTPLLQEQIQDVIGYLPLKTIQLSPEVKALLGLANNLTPEQLQNKLKEICRRYEAGRQLFQKICANHQIKENNNERASTSEVESKEAKAKESVDHQDIQLSDSSFIEVDGPRFIPGEEALSNLLWFFYLHGGLQNDENIFEEGTFTIVGDRNGQDNNSLEILLQFCLDSGAKGRMASHFANWRSYGIDIKHFELPPVGKQHLLFGKGDADTADAHRMYFKPENYGVSAADGIKHFWEYIVAQVRKISPIRRAINYVVEFRSDDTFKKERCPEEVANAYKEILKEVSLLFPHEPIEKTDKIYRIVEILTNLLAKIADRESELPDITENRTLQQKLERTRELIKKALNDLAKSYPDDFRIRCGNEICLSVQDLLNAPRITPSSDGSYLLA